MWHFRSRSLFLLPTFTLFLAGQAFCQTPAPATDVPFPLPLADQTTVQARLLPAPNEQAYLVYSTKTGLLGIWTMTPGQTPIPPDPEPEPTPPIPPTPQRLTIAIVEDPSTTTPQQRHVLSDDAWRVPATKYHDLVGIIPKDVKEPNSDGPPPLLEPFLDEAKRHLYPWVMFYSSNGSLVYSGPLPSSGQALTELIEKFGGSHAATHH